MSLGLKTSWGRQKPVLGSQLDRSHPLAQALIGLWLFGEGAGVVATDLSQSAKNGSLVNSPAWTPEGIRFAGGSAYIDISKSPLPEADWTVAMKIRPSVAGSTHDDNTVFSANSPGSNYGYYMSVGGGVPHIYIGAPINTWFDSSAPIPVGKWSAVTWILRAGVIEMWVNGVLGAARANSMALWGPTKLIGRRVDGLTPAPTFSGDMEYVAFFDSALLPSQVESLHEDPYQVIAPPRSLAAWRYWSLPRLYVPRGYSQQISGSPFMGGN